MAQLRPDPTFYPSPKHAMTAPPEELAYVSVMDPNRGKPDGIAVVDVKSGSADFAKLVGWVAMPSPGDELHHFGWNACSSCLCPYAPHPHVERRYLIVPGINSSRVTIVDTKPDPRAPRIAKVIDRETIVRKAGYTAFHTVHCGPDGVYINALSSASGDGPGGILVLDHDSLDVRGAWERERGPQYLAYDFAWHLGHDTMITSEWGTFNMVRDGTNPDLLLNAKYGHALHVWDLRRRRHTQVLDLGAQHQMVLELRPAHDPTKAYGFAGVVVSLEDLSASIWLWRQEKRNGNGTWQAQKVITIPAEPADPEILPPFLKSFKAVPPLVTDLNLSVDDRFLYVSCWGIGELQQYDVSDPLHPRKTGAVRIGGIAGRMAHPSKPEIPLNGGPQMVELSRDGRRIYVTNSLYSTWDAQFYPDGIRSWMVKADASPEGGIRLDRDFFVAFADGMRSHQVRLQGGDASSDSFCYS